MRLSEERLAAARDFIMHPAHSTPAFREAAAPPVGAAMPIAWNEQHYVGTALQAYRGEIGGIAFKALGYFNWPEGVTKADRQATRQELLDFVAYNTGVPFAFFEEPIPGTPAFAMGRLRSVNSDVLSSFIRADGLMTTHDADLIRLSRDHFGQAFDISRQRQPSAVWPLVKHARVPGMPRFNKVLDWLDDAEIHYDASNFVELGVFCSRNDYESVNGYKEDCNLGENGELISRIIARTSRKFVFDANLNLTVSPRRAVHLLGGVSRILDIWSKHDMTPHDNHRGLPLNVLLQNGDLPEPLFNDLLQGYATELTIRTTEANTQRGLANPHDAAEQSMRRHYGRIGGPANMLDGPEMW